jgi:polyferredoxin
MDNLNLPKGLIRFSDESIHNQDNKQPLLQINNIKNWLPKTRPRLWGYLLALVISVSLFAIQILTKNDYEFHLSRDRGQLYFYNELNVSNAFTVSIQNKTAQTSAFDAHVNHPDLFISGGHALHLIAGQKASMTLTVSCKVDCPIRGKQPIEIIIKQDDEIKATLHSLFFAPTTP